MTERLYISEVAALMAFSIDLKNRRGFACASGGERRGLEISEEKTQKRLHVRVSKCKPIRAAYGTTCKSVYWKEEKTNQKKNQKKWVLQSVYQPC